MSVIGGVVAKAAIAKFNSRTLAIVFSAGIPILSSLKPLLKPAGNVPL